MAFEQYVICPCQVNEGFRLSGPRLPYPLRYGDVMEALGYAHHVARETGGSVWVVDRKGHPIIAETISGREPHLLGG